MSSPAPGLYLVATPIGNARDITLRALDLLAGADVLVAEDTRTLRRLMEIHGIAAGGRPVVSYHDHNGERVRPRLLAMLGEGKSVVYASDAGTPLVADPGYALARAAAEAGHAVTAAPGPSAALAALSLSGLPTDRFLFAGFLPPARAARQAALRELGTVPASLVVFEAPQRVTATLSDMAEVLGTRDAALCRELTKRFEEVRRGTLADLAAGAAADPPRGEIVLVVDRDRSEAGAEEIRAALREALDRMSVKDAAKVVSEAVGAPRREVYQIALALGREE